MGCPLSPNKIHCMHVTYYDETDFKGVACEKVVQQCCWCQTETVSHSCIASAPVSGHGPYNPRAPIKVD